MDILKAIFGGESEDSKLNALIDTNHKITLVHAAMCENYTQQVADLKQRILKIENFLKEQFKDAE